MRCKLARIYYFTVIDFRRMQMSPRIPLWLLSLLAAVSVTLGFCHHLRAADSRDDRDARNVTDDDGGEKQSDDAPARNYSGRLTVEINDKQPRDVIGSFATDSGALYLVRSSDQALVKRLIARDNQKCVLFGKLRNKGKYLVVSSIVEASSEHVSRHKSDDE
jgi:hypothetical protein